MINIYPYSALAHYIEALASSAIKGNQHAIEMLRLKDENLTQFLVELRKLIMGDMRLKLAKGEGDEPTR